MNTAITPPDRLQKRHEYARVERRGVRVHTHYFTLIALLASSVAQGRAGITVSKKIGKAHARNFIKRRARHLCRKHAALISRLQIVLIAKPPFATDDFAKVEKCFIQALQKLRNGLVNQAGRRQTESDGSGLHKSAPHNRRTQQRKPINETPPSE